MPNDVPPVTQQASSPSGRRGKHIDVDATADDQKPRADPAAAEALRSIWDRLAELRIYARYYLTAKLDRLKLTIRQIVLLAIVGVIAVIAAAGAVVTAIVLLLRGMAGGLATLCGHVPWLGDLLCGLLVLGIIVIALWYFLRSFAKASRRATVEKYEREQTRQRADIGHDVAQRAGETESI
jgi:uncharacterized membrane protein